MNGYDKIFKKCEKKSKHFFENFREQEAFSFIVNNEPLPCQESLRLGKTFNPELFEKYLNVRKSKLGFSEKIPYSKLDQLDTKHYMMSCFLFDYFIKNDIKIDNILEIGGGFGNWCYINQNIIDFKSWSIIDLEFVLKLQKWFLNTELESTEKIKFYNTEEIDEISDNYDLLICTHSLSEISKENFDIYMEKIIKNRVKYLFYSYHTYLPSIQLINYKKKKIEIFFQQIKNFHNEEGRVNNVLYIRK